MPAFTIVTTTAIQGSDAAEISALADDFGDRSEAVGYSRRMAEELLGMAEQLELDFDYSNVSLYDGDVVDQEPDPSHATFVGVWVLDDDGVAYITADEYHASTPDA